MRVGGATAVTVRVSLKAMTAAFQGITAEANDMEGVHHSGGVGGSSVVVVVKPVKPSIATTSRPFR